MMTQLYAQFIENIRQLFPGDEGEQLLSTIAGTAAETSVRVNAAKTAMRPAAAERVPWCSTGYYLQGHEPFTFDPIFHAGLYYVQDASSMIVDYIIRRLIDRPVRYLDLCAAPGGSGEGMFRKDPGAVEQWSPALVAQCAERQRLIIDNVWDAIAPGGLLIYSTCTYNRDENEAMVEYIEAKYGATVVDLDLPLEWNVAPGVGKDGCCRFLPHRTRGEGLFVCVLRKPGDDEARTAFADKRHTGTRSGVAAKVPDAVRNWLTGGSGEFAFSLSGDTVVAVPQGLARDVEAVSRQVKVLSGGVEVGTVKGKDIVPSQSLALSTALNRDAFVTVEVGYSDAIAYLRGDAIMLGDVPRGVVLLQYQGVPIGFAKQLGNRANNLYPREWRIRSTYAPSNPPQVPTWIVADWLLESFFLL